MAGVLSRVRSSLRSLLPLASSASVSGSGGWTLVAREPFAGAWQQNIEATTQNVLAHPAVFACTSLIASDIGKVSLQLVKRDADGIWTETESPAFSPVLRKPNRYQTTIKFLESWIVSKLVHGNAYVLKQRDQRGLVVALYVLDPCRVTPLVAQDGAIYYQLSRDDLSGLTEEQLARVPVVPASEVIHDLMIALFHPLVGVSPIFACGAAAVQGLTIQENATRFFGSGSNPGGLLLAPGKISDETAARLKKHWDENYSGVNVGKVAVLGDNLQYKALSVNAVDSQLIEQLKWTTETICACYHVPVPLIDASIQPPYGNSPEPLLQLYYSQCLQSLMTSIETCLDEGLELPKPYGTEFDIDDLIWFDTATRTKAAHDGIAGGGLSPNEAREKYFGLGPVKGGETPYLQQQNFSLAALAERDANDPFSKAAPAPAAPQPQSDDGTDVEKFLIALTKNLQDLSHAA